MTQFFEIFKGDPAALVARLNTLKGNGETITQVLMTYSAGSYLIIYES
jgi:hypothetical protein